MDALAEHDRAVERRPRGSEQTKRQTRRWRGRRYAGRSPRSGYTISSAHALAPGARLGRYQIQTLLGAGGMGEVYRATEPQLQREVAIKVLLRQLTYRPNGCFGSAGSAGHGCPQSSARRRGV